MRNHKKVEVEVAQQGQEPRGPAIVLWKLGFGLWARESGHLLGQLGVSSGLGEAAGPGGGLRRALPQGS